MIVKKEFEEEPIREYKTIIQKIWEIVVRKNNKKANKKESIENSICTSNFLEVERMTERMAECMKSGAISMNEMREGMLKLAGIASPSKEFMKEISKKKNYYNI